MPDTGPKPTSDPMPTDPSSKGAMRAGPVPGRSAPAYLRIAADLRERIMAGDLPPGGKLPTEAELRRRYAVSSTVAKWAVSLLKSEGLVEGRRGSGVYVRVVRRITRHAAVRSARGGSGSASPFARDATRAGHSGSCEHESAREAADTRVAVRLAIEPGEPVMRTAYRFLADGEPVQLSTSWEPVALTGGTPVEWPEGGPAVGVVPRMDLIGVRVDEFVERVTARPASPRECQALVLPQRGAHVLLIERTYLAAGRPVETADIVFPGDRYDLVYRLPVD
ncbi:GntR family transcriptional regulator [Rhizomonospora bruguierae]|uniref:GntR family transcriptional regulator n=1 Tax=Rhizomonospora bruguierae TaxID=1581705 RepID=UPI001BCB80CB|nr:GntR family transcriptional regulator [Micromonospora sp. NBRC 107566]